MMIVALLSQMNWSRSSKIDVIHATGEAAIANPVIEALNSVKQIKNGD